MAMSCYYLKGIAPPHVRLTQIFWGVTPYLFIIILSMVIVYVFPQIVYWLPDAALWLGAPARPRRRSTSARSPCATASPPAR